jgi:hypothetical protein
MLGESCVLDAAAQRLVARWLTLKLVTAEHAREAAVVTSVEDRRGFRAGGEVGGNWKIWIARHEGRGWRNGFLRHSGAVGSVPKGEMPVPAKGPLSKNTQFFVFGAGQLLAVAISSYVDGFDVGFPPEYAHIMRRIHPFEGSVAWPPLVTLGDEAITGIITEFDAFLGRLRWAPEI